MSEIYGARGAVRRSWPIGDRIDVMVATDNGDLSLVIQLDPERARDMAVSLVREADAIDAERAAKAAKKPDAPEQPKEVK